MANNKLFRPWRGRGRDNILIEKKNPLSEDASGRKTPVAPPRLFIRNSQSNTSHLLLPLGLDLDSPVAILTYPMLP